MSVVGMRRRQVVLLIPLFAFLIGFVALGNWQLERRAWKLELIERVEAHLSAEPIAAPGPDAWRDVDKRDEYRRVGIQGRFDHEREVLSQAVTELGPGFWVLTPLRTEAGWWVWVNRGFVDQTKKAPTSRAESQSIEPLTVSGLLRLSEPGGGFLRRNDPAAERWYSRDVAVMSEAKGLASEPVAPYFIDADASLPGGPQGGLTVVRFRNSHLVYALTWYALAGMTLMAIIQVFRLSRRPAQD